MAYKYDFSMTQTTNPQPPYVNTYGYDSAIALCSFINTEHPFYVIESEHGNVKRYTFYYIGHEEITIDYKLST